MKRSTPSSVPTSASPTSGSAIFSNDSDSLNSNELLSTDSDDEQEDDLEIPAFLRRQKN